MTSAPAGTGVLRSMLTVAEVADELRISPDLVYRMAKNGEIESRRFGRRIVIPRVVVDALTGANRAPVGGKRTFLEGDK